MKSLDLYLINLIAASSGYPLGQLKDNPGDNSGTGIVAQTHNDILYSLVAAITKYSAISDTNESTTDSDFIDAIERLTGHGHGSVSEYSNSTTYAINEQVFFYGIQFVSLQGSNTGNSPLTSHTYWAPAPETVKMFQSFVNGEILRSGMDPVDESGGGSFQTWIKYGIHNLGGTSGQDYQAYKVHLDGTVVTGDTDLETIFDPGGVNEYRFIDTVAPDSMGTRTLIDYSATATGEAAEGVPYIIVMLPV